MWEAATEPCVEEGDPWGIWRCRSGLLPFGLSTACSSVVAEALQSSVSQAHRRPPVPWTGDDHLSSVPTSTIVA